MMTTQAEPVRAGKLRSATPISKLVAQVYEAAPMAERSRLLAQLLKPLGVLSLAVVAHGIFPYISICNGPRFFDIRTGDLQNVRVDEVIALVDFVQQFSIESVESLVQMFSPGR